uniref:Putative HNH homing endonuclease n=1 Tax=Uronema confervicola TaxID=764120 RepID=A0A6H1U729_9CHLO|nr:putative HNH homing endonuclease [Uronema confervicola]QIZ74187.1 putative HNH homing endonuclease [Uronema confervicola]
MIYIFFIIKTNKYIIMTAKLSLEKLELEVQNRGHVLIFVSNKENLRTGFITVQCSANHVFKTSVKSYLSCRVSLITNKKCGCSKCKKLLSVLNFEKKDKKKKIFKSTTKRVPECFKNIVDKHSMIEYLVKNKNSYNNFILQKLEEQRQLIQDCKELNLATEVHHIIPKSLGGVNENWNTVTLTTSDHTLAHQLRYEVFGDIQDELASRLRSQSTVSSREAQLERIRLSHKSTRKNQTGFFSSEQQAKNGRKGGAAKSESNTLKHFKKLSPLVQEKIKKGLVFRHKDLKENVIIPPSTTFLPTNLLDIFLQKLPETSKYYNSLKNINKYSFSSSLGKVLREERKTYLGFSLVS